MMGNRIIRSLSVVGLVFLITFMMPLNSLAAVTVKPGPNTVTQGTMVVFSMTDYKPADSTDDINSDSAVESLQNRINNANSTADAKRDAFENAFKDYTGYNGNSSSRPTGNYTGNGSVNKAEGLSFEDVMGAVDGYGQSEEGKKQLREWIKSFGKGGSSTGLNEEMLNDVIDALKGFGKISDLGKGTYEERRKKYLDISKLFNALYGSGIAGNIADALEAFGKEGIDEFTDAFMKGAMERFHLEAASLYVPYIQHLNSQYGYLDGNKYDAFYIKCHRCSRYYSQHSSCDCGYNIKVTGNYQNADYKLLADVNSDTVQPVPDDERMQDCGMTSTGMLGYIKVYDPKGSQETGMILSKELTCQYCGRLVTKETSKAFKNGSLVKNFAKRPEVHISRMMITSAGKWICQDCYSGDIHSGYDSSSDGTAEYYLSGDMNSVTDDLNDLLDGITPDAAWKWLEDCIDLFKLTVPDLLDEIVDMLPSIDISKYEIGTNQALRDAVATMLQRAAEAAQKVKDDGAYADPYRRAFKENKDFKEARDAIFADWADPGEDIANSPYWTDEQKELYKKWKQMYEHSGDNVKDSLDKITQNGKDKTGTELAEDLQKLLTKYGQSATSIEDSVSMSIVIDTKNKEAVGETIRYEEYRGAGYAIDFNGTKNWFINEFWTGGNATKLMSMKGNYVIHRYCKKWDMSVQTYKETLVYKWMITINGESRELMSDEMEYYSIDTSGKNDNNASVKKLTDITITVVPGNKADLSVTDGHSTEQIW